MIRSDALTDQWLIAGPGTRHNTREQIILQKT